MGAIAADYVNTAVNNQNYQGSNWAGDGSLGKTVNNPANNSSFKYSTKTYVQIETEKAINGLGAKSKSAAILYSIKALNDFFNVLKNSPSIDLSSLSDDQKAIMQNAESTLAQQSQLEDYLARQMASASTPATTGETLPSVLKSNTKALVESIGTLTSTFASKFDYFNNYMYGLLNYMDIATGFMNDANTLNKNIYDEAKKEKDDNAVTVGDTKMSPSEIEAKKNLAMLKAYDFKNTPVATSVLEADNVLGMTPLEIEASHRSFEIESKVYAMTPISVKDWDNNALRDVSPREARLVKDATTAIKHTDENNFELDDEDMDIAKPFDVSSIYGYSDDALPLKEFFTHLGGQGL